MRQIVYASDSQISGSDEDTSAIFNQSRHNNAIDGISGLLCFDGKTFLQVFEGPKTSVAATFERIRNDSRHSNLTVLVDRPLSAREFGTWSMRCIRLGEDEEFGEMVRRTLVNAPSEVAAPFYRMLTDWV